MSPSHTEPALRWSQGEDAFQIEPGVCAAIVERSTHDRRRLAKTLATLSQTPQSRLEVFGVDAPGAINRTRTMATYCSLDAGLYDELSVEQYLRFFASLWQKSAQSVAAAIEVCALTSRMHTPLRRLTVGERAFVNLARSLVADPALFIFDGLNETGLETSQPLWQLFHELNECDKTCIVCLPRLSAKTMLCSQAIVFDHGKLLYCGSMGRLNELLNNRSIGDAASIEVRTPARKPELDDAFDGLNFTVSLNATGAVVRAAQSNFDTETMVVEVSRALVAAGLPFTALMPVSDHGLGDQLRQAVGSGSQ